MALRRLTAREYAINLAMTVACWPVYARREWADRDRLDAFALRRAREMADHAALTVPVYAERCRDAGVDPAGIRTWDDLWRLPLMDKATIVSGYPERSVARGADLTRCLLSTSSGSGGATRLGEALSRAVRPGGRVLVRSILPDGGLPAHPALLLDPLSATVVEQERTAPYGRVDLLRRT